MKSQRLTTTFFSSIIHKLSFNIALMNYRYCSYFLFYSVLYFYQHLINNSKIISTNSLFVYVINQYCTLYAWLSNMQALVFLNTKKTSSRNTMRNDDTSRTKKQRAAFVFHSRHGYKCSVLSRIKSSFLTKILNFRPRKTLIALTSGREYPCHFSLTGCWFKLELGGQQTAKNRYFCLAEKRTGRGKIGLIQCQRPQRDV